MQPTFTHSQHCHHDCLAQRDVQRTWDRLRTAQVDHTMQRCIPMVTTASWRRAPVGLGP